MALTMPEAVAALCTAFPEVTAKSSHGMPTWHARGRHFATFSLNHHGDGRVALQLRLPPEQAADLIASDADIFFVPAYTGGKGWVGIELNGGVDWNEVLTCTREAWRHACPEAEAGPLPRIARPRRMRPEQIDPLLSKRGRVLHEGLRRICLALPEASEGRQFGSPSFRAGKKGFCTLHAHRGRFAVQTWVGLDAQALLTLDPRFAVPAYIGSSGWIELAVHEEVDWPEVEALALQSYRHFALARMLRALDG